MKNPLELLKSLSESIALYFEGEPPVPPVEQPPVTPATHTLKDGRILSVTALEAGQDAIIDGVPAPADEYELEDGQIVVVGEDGKISEVKAATPVDAPPAADPAGMSPEQMRDLAQGFAEGTPEERIAKIETISRALMEYCFGWELREATQKAIKDQAIAVYKSGFESHENEKDEKIKGLEEKLNAYEAKFSKQGEVMKQMFEVIEALAKVPQDDAPEDQHRKTSFAKTETAKTQKERYLQKIAELAKKKTEA